MKTYRTLSVLLPLHFLASLIQASDSLSISLRTTTPTSNETLVENHNSTVVLTPIQLFHENSTSSPGEKATSTSTDKGSTTTETFTLPPAVQRLTQVINDTILNINELIISSMQNVSRQGQNDFKKVGELLQNMQSFLSQRGTIISQDAETNLERELKGIQSFIGEHQHKFQNLSNSNLTKSQIHILQVGLEPGNINPDQITVGERNASNSRTAKGGPQSGMVNNIMQFSSKVGQGLRSTIEGAENIVTNSVNQIQSQIQNFLNGITNFFAKNTSQQNQMPLMFRRQQVISQ